MRIEWILLIFCIIMIAMMLLTDWYFSSVQKCYRFMREEIAQTRNLMDHIMNHYKTANEMHDEIYKQYQDMETKYTLVLEKIAEIYAKEDESAVDNGSSQEEG